MIQVSKTLEDEKTFKRELRAFKVAQKELGKDKLLKLSHWIPQKKLNMTIWKLKLLIYWIELIIFNLMKFFDKENRMTISH